MPGAGVELRLMGMGVPTYDPRTVPVEITDGSATLGSTDGRDFPSNRDTPSVSIKLKEEQNNPSNLTPGKFDSSGGSDDYDLALKKTGAGGVQKDNYISKIPVTMDKINAIQQWAKHKYKEKLDNFQKFKKKLENEFFILQKKYQDNRELFDERTSSSSTELPTPENQLLLLDTYFHVHHDTPKKKISAEQLKQIFTETLPEIENEEVDSDEARSLEEQTSIHLESFLEKAIGTIYKEKYSKEHDRKATIEEYYAAFSQRLKLYEGTEFNFDNLSTLPPNDITTTNLVQIRNKNSENYIISQLNVQYIPQSQDPTSSSPDDATTPEQIHINGAFDYDNAGSDQAKEFELERFRAQMVDQVKTYSKSINNPVATVTVTAENFELALEIAFKMANSGVNTKLKLQIDPTTTLEEQVNNLTNTQLKLQIKQLQSIELATINDLLKQIYTEAKATNPFANKITTVDPIEPVPSPPPTPRITR